MNEWRSSAHASDWSPPTHIGSISTAAVFQKGRFRLSRKRPIAEESDDRPNSLLADVSDPVATKDLRALVKAGLLEAVGEKRGRHYIASPELLEIRMRHQDREEIPDPYELAERTAAIGSIR